MRKKIRNSSKIFIHSEQKLGYTACISIPRLKNGHFCEHGFRNPFELWPILLKYIFCAKKNKQEIRRLGRLALDDLGIPLQRFEQLIKDNNNIQ